MLNETSSKLFILILIIIPKSMFAYFTEMCTVHGMIPKLELGFAAIFSVLVRDFP